jgi:hypothetical protein
LAVDRRGLTFVGAGREAWRRGGWNTVCGRDASPRQLPTNHDHDGDLATTRPVVPYLVICDESHL